MSLGNIASLLGLNDIFKGRKPSVLKELLDNPENYKLEAWIENGEITVKIRKKPKLVPQLPAGFAKNSNAIMKGGVTP